jgi:subtilisin family serine protease
MAANSSYNTVIKKGATTLGDITSISLSGITRTEIDVTALTDTAKTYLMGTVDSGTIEVSFNYDDTLDDYVPATGSSTSSAWSIVYQVGSSKTQTLSFNAFEQSFSIEAGVDAALTGNLTLRIDGVVTFGAPA